MTSRARSASRTVPALLLLAGLCGLCPPVIQGQGFTGLVADCAGSSEELTILCHRAALSLDASRSGVSTAAAQGNEVPGSASTLGYRLRSSPRFALSARGGLSRFPMVDLGREATGSGPVPMEEVLVPSLHFMGTVGILNGFSPVPTVGGVLSLDATLSVDKVFASGTQGLRDGPLAWGLGARVGLLRESFTLPGVSVSATRRWMGSTEVGDVEGGDPGEAAYDWEVSSLRGVVGKNILGVGLLAGVGWDRLSGGGRIRVQVPGGGAEGSGSSQDLVSKRFVFFAGGSMTFVILQVSAEAGWSRALDQELAREPFGTSFPSLESYFGSIAFRITF